MLTTILSHSDPIIKRGIAHVLSKVDFQKLRARLTIAECFPTETYRVVLFEYVHSSVNDQIAEMERIPGTTYFIHNFLKKIEVDNILITLFATKSNMKIYNRRKLDMSKEGQDRITKYRQLVLEVSPQLPSPVLNPEDNESLDEAFILEPQAASL